jgi:hypothetical protein
MCGLGTVMVICYIVWFGTCVGQWLYFVVFLTLLVSGYSDGQWLYCVGWEQCWLVIIMCGFLAVLVSGFIVWFWNSVS